MAASAMRTTEPPHTSTSGGPWPSRSNASVVPSFEVTVSIPTSFLGREDSRQPVLPRGLGLRLIEAVDEDVVADAGRAAEHADVHEPVDAVVRTDPEEVPGEPVDDTVQLRQPVRGEMHGVAEGHRSLKTQRLVESLPCFIPVGHHRAAEDVHRRGRPAAEVGEVDTQLVEVHRVSLGEALVLLLPVLSEEPAVHPADDRAALVAPLDDVLERME